MITITLIALLISTSAWAGGCFPEAYYSAMFQPQLQEAKGGHPGLVGMSDYVGAKGTQPPEHGVGCACGLNNGRWDQVLVNQTPALADQAPAAFRITGIKVQFHDKDGKAKGPVNQINPDRMADCFGGGMTAEGYRSFKDAPGLSDDPSLLEQGENTLGCLCLADELRTLTGKAWIEVGYQTAVWARPLAPGQSVPVEGLAKGQAVYFKLSLPQGQAKLSLALKDAANAKVYYLDAGQAWSPAMAQWQAGPLEQDKPTPGDYWIMVRSTADGASGVLAAGPGAAAPASPAQPKLTEVGQADRRTFQAFMAGAGPNAKLELPGITGKGSCCKPQ